MTSTEMETFARRCIEELSPAHRDKLESVLLVIDEWPDQAILRTAGCGEDEMLLGFYEGIPLPDRTTETAANLPDRISLFRQPILVEASELDDDASIREKTERVLRETLLHEIAHFFGYDDDELDELGVY